VAGWRTSADRAFVVIEHVQLRRRGFGEIDDPPGRVNQVAARAELAVLHLRAKYAARLQSPTM